MDRLDDLAHRLRLAARVEESLDPETCRLLFVEAARALDKVQLKLDELSLVLSRT